jgi:hypothetical protein
MDWVALVVKELLSGADPDLVVLMLWDRDAVKLEEKQLLAEKVEVMQLLGEAQELKVPLSVAEPVTEAEPL